MNVRDKNMDEINQIGKLILQELAKKHKTKCENNKYNGSIGYIKYNNTKYHIIIYPGAKYETNINLQYEMCPGELSGWIVAYYINNSKILCGIDDYVFKHREVIKNIDIANPDSIQIIVDVFDDVLIKAKISL